MTETTGARAPSGTFTLGRASVRIAFVARHAIGPKVRGHFERVEGIGHLDVDDASRLRAELNIDAVSVQTGNKQRDAHLCAKFFDTSNYPNITFTVTRGEQTTPGCYRVAGDLAIRGVTAPITLDLEPVDTAGKLGDDPDRVRFTSTAVVSRRALGVRWNSLWDAAVADQVTLHIEVTGTR